MKKFFALFAMVACFGMMSSNAQSIKALLFPSDSGDLYWFDSIAFEQINPKSVSFITPWDVYIGGTNTGDSLFPGDSIEVEMTINETHFMAGTLTLGDTTIWAKDSNMTFKIGALEIPIAMVKEGDFANQICAKITKVYTKGEYRDVADEGFCGVFTISFATVGVAESEMEAINMYPNPVRNSLTIENANNVNVNIYAANGQMVKTFVANGTTTVNMNDLSSGLYIVKMQGEKASRVEKVQVVR